MTRAIALCTASALAAWLCLQTAPVQAQTAIGVNAQIRNVVQMKTAADRALRPAVVRESVHLGDGLASGAQSSLQVLLLDKSVFTLGSNARMTVDRFVYDPDRRTSDVAASISKGAFRFMSGPTLAGRGRNVVTTPVASIGVRGTMFDGVVGPDALAVMQGDARVPQDVDAETATLVVLRGPGPHSQGSDKPGAIDVSGGGQTTAVESPGLAVFVSRPGAAPVGPFRLSTVASRRLGDLLGLGKQEGRTAPSGSQPSVPVGSVAGASGARPGEKQDTPVYVYNPMGLEVPLHNGPLDPDLDEYLDRRWCSPAQVCP